MPVYVNPADAPSELQRLLLLAVPANKNGHKSILHLAFILGISRWAIQKWIVKGKSPPERAVQVVDISEGRVSLTDFSRFVYML
jgi:hypothetical protein